jgi:hypothetical protein
MRVRQSHLKTWNKCPLIFKFEELDGLPREQSGSLTFGSIIHDCVLWMEVNQDVDGAVARFEQLWAQPTLLDPTYQPQYYVRGTSWKKFMEKGPKLLRDWWAIISWDSALVLGREHYFEVPIGDGHTLVGTVDKIEVGFRADINGGLGGPVLKISDYKTNNKAPTYDYLAEDLQFSAYAYASTRPEFWATIGGDAAWQRYRDLPRYGEWVQLAGPKRMDAGIRGQRHYNRIEMAVNAMAESVAMRIFVPNISGESCRYCEFREVCGLPKLDENGQEVAA